MPMARPLALPVERAHSAGIGIDGRTLEARPPSVHQAHTKLTRTALLTVHKAAAHKAGIQRYLYCSVASVAGALWVLAHQRG
jgi:hypothetical protein